MKHEIRKTIRKLLMGHNRTWMVVVLTLLALLAATAIMGSVHVRISADQPSIYAAGGQGKTVSVPPTNGQQDGSASSATDGQAAPPSGGAGGSGSGSGSGGAQDSGGAPPSGGPRDPGPKPLTQRRWIQRPIRHATFVIPTTI